VAACTLLCIVARQAHVHGNMTVLRALSRLSSWLFANGVPHDHMVTRSTADDQHSIGRGQPLPWIWQDTLCSGRLFAHAASQLRTQIAVATSYLHSNSTENPLQIQVSASCDQSLQPQAPAIALDQSFWYHTVCAALRVCVAGVYALKQYIQDELLLLHVPVAVLGGRYRALWSGEV